MLYGTLATTAPFKNISALCNRDKKTNIQFFGKLKEPHAKVQRAAVWPPLLYGYVRQAAGNNKQWAVGPGSGHRNSSTQGSWGVQRMTFHPRAKTGIVLLRKLRCHQPQNLCSGIAECEDCWHDRDKMAAGHQCTLPSRVYPKVKMARGSLVW